MNISGHSRETSILIILVYMSKIMLKP
jgi:hypothetical protein